MLFGLAGQFDLKADAIEGVEAGIGVDIADGEVVNRIRLMRLIDDTEGTLYLSQIPSARSRSLISQPKIPGSFCFSSRMNPTTFGVVTRGLLPPMALGRMDPVSLYRARIFETHPWLTRSCLEMSQGRIPSCASWMIWTRIGFGKGRPLTKTPPNWKMIFQNQYYWMFC